MLRTEELEQRVGGQRPAIRACRVPTASFGHSQSRLPVPPSGDPAVGDDRRQQRDQHASGDRPVLQQVARDNCRRRSHRGQRRAAARQRTEARGPGMRRRYVRGAGERSLGVDGAVARSLGFPAARPIPRAADQRVADLRCRQVGELRPDQRRDASHDGAGRPGAVHRLIASRGGGDHSLAGGGQGDVRLAAAIGGESEPLVERADRNHSRIRSWKGHRVAGHGVVTGRRDQHHILADGIGDGRPLGGAAAGRGGGTTQAGRAGHARVDRQVDDARPVPHRVADPACDRIRQSGGNLGVSPERVTRAQGDPDGEDPDSRGDAEDAGRPLLAVPMTCDQAGQAGAHQPEVRAAGGPSRAGEVRS